MIIKQPYTHGYGSDSKFCVEGPGLALVMMQEHSGRNAG